MDDHFFLSLPKEASDLAHEDVAAIEAWFWCLNKRSTPNEKLEQILKEIGENLKKKDKVFAHSIAQQFAALFVILLDNEKIRRQVYVVIEYLAKFEQIKELILEQDGLLNKLINHLEDIEAKRAITILVTNSVKNRSLIGKKTEIFQILINFIQQNYDSAHKVQACVALANLAFRHDDNRLKIDIDPIITEIKLTKDDHVKEACLRVLARVARNSQISAKIAANNAFLEYLVLQLNDQNDKIVMITAAVLGQMATDSEEISMKMYHMKFFFDKIFTLAFGANTSPGSRFMTIALLANLAYHNDELRYAIVGHDLEQDPIIQALIQVVIMADTQDIRRMAAVTLGHCCRTEQIRSRIYHHGGLPAFEILRNSSDKGFILSPSASYDVSSSLWSRRRRN